MAEAVKSEGSSPARWGIFDRLKNLPYLYSTRDSSITPSRTTKGEIKNISLKKTTETEIKQEVIEVQTPLPEEEQWDMLSKYVNIRQNEFAQRDHVSQKEDDIAVCVCAEATGCKELCLNILTSVECTPGHCPCGNLCQNQKFQKCEYAKVQMVKTDGRGWGLLADQDIREGDFLIEYCGEVVSDKVAQSRVHAYEEAGVKDKYIISLDGNEFLDATRKGSLARFINHSCEPNCITRKWTVLGEVRIGIFALRDIKKGEELTYDYNFQWFGGNKIKCCCGAPSCVGFLGAKSRGFQDIFGFEDGDGRVPGEDTAGANNEGTWSNQELLNQLYAMAVGVRNFQNVGAKPKLTQLVGEVKDKRVRAKKLTPDRKADLKKEKLEKKVLTPKESTPKMKKTTTLKEKKVTEENLQPGIQAPQKGLQVQGKQVDISQIAQKTPGGSSAKKTPKDRAPKALSKTPLSEDELRLFAKKTARKIEGRGGLEEQSTMTKKARVSAKNMVNQRIHAFSLNQQRLSEAATMEVMAAQEQEAVAAAEMTELLDEIRGVRKDREKGDYDALPLELTERWVAATTKQLRTSFDFHFTVVRHMIGPTRSLSVTEV